MLGCVFFGNIKLHITACSFFCPHQRLCQLTNNWNSSLSRESLDYLEFIVISCTGWICAVHRCTDSHAMFLLFQVKSLVTCNYSGSTLEACVASGGFLGQLVHYWELRTVTSSSWCQETLAGSFLVNTFHISSEWIVTKSTELQEL